MRCAVSGAVYGFIDKEQKYNTLGISLTREKKGINPIDIDR